MRTNQDTAAEKIQRNRNYAKRSAKGKKRSRKTGKVEPSDHYASFAAEDLKMNGQPLGDIHNLLTDGSLERTISGASVLELKLTDPQRQLQHTGAWQKGTVIDIEDVKYAQVKSVKGGDDFTIDYEDYEINVMRRDTTPVMAYRDKITRAEFVLALIQGINRRHHTNITMWCPQLTKKQPIQKHKQQPSKPKRASNASGGFGSGSVTVKHVAANSSQKSVMAEALSVGESLNAPGLAMLAVLVTLIQENSCTNSRGGDGSSNGAFQVTAPTAANYHLNPMDVSACAHQFFTGGFYGRGGAISLAHAHPGADPGWIAQQCQGSAFPSAYQQWDSEARQNLAAFGGGGGGGGGGGSTKQYERYAFFRGQNNQPESTWDCATRLAKEVNWYCFMVTGQLAFCTADDLFAVEPVMSISEDSPGVHWIDWEIDESPKAGADIVTITADIDFWEAPPGTTVEITGSGAANGRWLVSDVKRTLYDTTATITCAAPMKPKPEPAPKLTSASTGGGSAGSGGGSGGDLPTRLYNAGKAIAAKNYPYVWGGGHARAGVPSGRPPGYDCSGFISAVTHGCGILGNSPLTSVGFASWGKSGKGEKATVWTNPSHVWMEVNLGGNRRYYVGTGHGGNGGPNIAPYPGDSYAAGFTPRHVDGM